MSPIPALDGVRGIAILAVLLFHYTFVSCGWAGVQLFFVLSGFLITSILQHDRELPLATYLKRFYWRRTLRIFPLYYGYLAVLTVWFVATGAPLVFARHWPYLWTYTLNYRRLLPDFENNPYFGHFWSLAIEEQFYLFWPILVYSMPRRTFGRFVLILIAVCPLIRLASASLLANAIPAATPEYLGQAVYSFTPGQVDAFAFGAVVAIFPQLTRRAGTRFAVISIVLLAAGQLNGWPHRHALTLDTSLGYDINMFANGQHVWGYTLIDAWAASLVALARTARPLTAPLAIRPLVFVGRISYGMYVYHRLLQALTADVMGPRHSIANLAVFAGYTAIVIAVSSLSYRLLERPFLALKDARFGRVPRIEEGAAVAVTACAGSDAPFPELRTVRHRDGP